MIEKKVELLAPAGNPEGFYGAIRAGADAIYLGGAKFGARAYADNFTQDELVEGIRYAHVMGRRVYLTVNTLMKQKELAELYDYLLPYYEAGLDGVIVQDIGAFCYIREHFPGMELHVSTQMTLTGKHGADLLKEMGACRIVPARELSLEELREIKESTGLEIETFIHGAMCYCYSGQCLFSSILGGRSGNRGRCAQPCRLPYRVETGGRRIEECYPLSLKDMCTIEHIPDLIEAGIDSFKIEGRMKKPEYAAGVTAIYRKYIDRYYKNPDKKFTVADKDLKALSHLYIRSERQNGYYYKHNGADMVTLESPAYSGSDEELLQQLRKEYLEERLTLEIDIYADFQVGQRAQVTFVCGEAAVSVEGAVVDTAQKQPVTSANIEKQLRKLGGTAFHAGQTMITVDDTAFYPLKEINELRREAVVRLEEQLILQNGLVFERAIQKPKQSEALEAVNIDTTSMDSAEKNSAKRGIGVKTGVTLALRTLPQLEAVLKLQKEEELTLERVYVDGDLLCGASENVVKAVNQLAAKGIEVFTALPYILRKRDETYLERLFSVMESMPAVSGCMVRSLEGYAYLQQKGYKGKLASDAGWYVWNRETLSHWRTQLDSCCLPLELNNHEQRSLIEEAQGLGVPMEKVIYGRIPMMVTANCVARTTGKCQKGQGEGLAVLTDRYQKNFPVELNCTHCMNIIYNSVPLSLHKEWERWSKKVMLRLNLTVEGGEETEKVLGFFQRRIFSAGGEKPPYEEYTSGHEKRGVE